MTAESSRDPHLIPHRLIACPSVAPDKAGALDDLQRRLEPAGFFCHRLPFWAHGARKLNYLFARIATSKPRFRLADHVDVAPAANAL